MMMVMIGDEDTMNEMMVMMTIGKMMRIMVMMMMI